MDHSPTVEELGYYRAPGPMTHIDEGRHGPALDGLVAEPGPLAQAVRGVLIHRDWAPHLGVQFSDDRLADQHLRPVDEVLARIAELDAEPLRVARPLPDRMVGVCRHYAVLHVALLRRAGIPARARAGFARYFGDGWSDHWITERWDGRWIRDDAQIGTIARQVLALEFDSADQPEGEFLTGAEAWIRCRAGEADPNEFGIFDEHGLWFVLGDLMLDLAALNKVELLPWDSWSSTGGPQWSPSASELAEVDELADAICRDDLVEIRNRYDDLRVPSRITSLMDGDLTHVDLGHLVEVERLGSAAT